MLASTDSAAAQVVSARAAELNDFLAQICGWVAESELVQDFFDVHEQQERHSAETQSRSALEDGSRTCSQQDMKSLVNERIRLAEDAEELAKQRPNVPVASPSKSPRRPVVRSEEAADDAPAAAAYGSPPASTAAAELLAAAMAIEGRASTGGPQEPVDGDRMEPAFSVATEEAWTGLQTERTAAKQAAEMESAAKEEAWAVAAKQRDAERRMTEETAKDDAAKEAEHLIRANLMKNATAAKQAAVSKAKLDSACSSPSSSEAVDLDTALMKEAEGARAVHEQTASASPQGRALRRLSLSLSKNEMEELSSIETSDKQADPYAHTCPQLSTTPAAAGAGGIAANDEGETSKRNTQEAMQSAAKDAEDLIRINLKNASPDAAKGEQSQSQRPAQGSSDVGSCKQPSACQTDSRPGSGNCDPEAAAAALAAVQNAEESREKLSRLFSEESLFEAGK